MTAHLQAALAFALTIMALATIVTLIMEILSRLVRRRNRNLLHMLELVYETHINPRIKKEKGVSDASDIHTKNFAKRIASSAFEPDRCLWWDSALSKVANLLGAGTANEMSRNDFMRRLARDKVGNELRKQAGDHIDTVVEQIALRFDEVSDAAHEYFLNSSRIISILVGITLALVVNIDGIRIYEDFIDDPAKAARFVDQAEAYKKAFIEAQGRLDQGIAAMRQENSGSTYSSGQPQSANESGNAKTSDTPEENNPLKDMDEAISKVKAGLSDLTTQGISIGWKFSPHCDWIDSGRKCENGKLGFYDKVGWFISAIITGILIGLGGPFWYDVVMSLTRATQIMRGHAPKETTVVSADEPPDKLANATKIFETHLSISTDTTTQATSNQPTGPR